MNPRILLVSPDEGFGELIRQALIETGDYRVDLVPAGIPALAAAQEHAIDLAILDCAAVDVPPAELVSTLLDWHPEMRLIVVPPENDSNHPSLESIVPQAYLTKPFYLPELAAVVNGILRRDTREEALPDSQAPEIEEYPPYPWLEDVNRAAQYLARLTLETAARAALIARGMQLWAYAGDLGQPAGDELAAEVGRQWGSQRGNDLARFVTLENEQEYMLYATGLPDGLVLALIFDARTPFSKIRSQSSRLARALTSGPEGNVAVPQPESPAPVQEALNEEPGGQFVEVESPIQAQGAAAAQLEAVESGSLPVDWLPPNLSDDWRLLEEVEESIKPFSIPTDWQPGVGIPPGPRAYLEELLGEALPPASLPYQGVGERGPGSAAGLFDERPHYPPPESLAETRPTRVPLEEALPALEPESASYISITYACVLLPRMPQHHLVSDLAKLVEDRMLQVCVSFDWRLEQMSIRPGYLQFMVRVHSATAPRFLMQIVTRLTSQRIFEDFPRYLTENPSGEFWAPGWLVVTSDKSPSPQLVQQFIAKTRRRQGLG